MSKRAYIDKFEMCRLYVSGLTEQEIADKLGCNQTYVSQMKRQNGWPHRVWANARPVPVSQDQAHLVTIVPRGRKPRAKKTSAPSAPPPASRGSRRTAVPVLPVTSGINPDEQERCEVLQRRIQGLTDDTFMYRCDI